MINSISRMHYLIWLTWKKLLSRPVLTILILLLIIYIAATIFVMTCERTGFGAAAVQLLPAFFGELGEVGSPIPQVQICIIIGILVSVTFVAIVTAKITSIIIEYIRQGGSVAKKVSFTDHTIICGWNFQGERIVKDIQNACGERERGIVILADKEKRPVSDIRVEFVQGDPSQDENLMRAGLERANSVIVLTDFDKGTTEADAEALMIALAVESLNPEVHSCVQIMNSSNRRHLERAHVDEIICLDQAGGSLIVASAIYHGTSHLLSELLTFNEGSEIYRCDKPLSNAIVNKEFAEAVKVLIEQRIILVAVEVDYTEELTKEMGNELIHKLPEVERAVIVNPQCNYKIQQGDSLFIIAESLPSKI